MDPQRAVGATRKDAFSTLRVSSCALTGSAPSAAAQHTVPLSTSVLGAETPATEPKLVIKLRRAKALTPYIPEAWEHSLTEANLLSKYPTILDGLRFGFDAGLSNLAHSYTPRNSPSLEEHKDIFSDIISKEFTKGRYIGPFNQDTLESLIGPLQSAPLSLVPKPGKPGKFRLVQNLSFPYKSRNLVSSPNSRVDPDQFPTHYSTFQITSTIISALPPGSQAAVRDVAEAYRTIPSHPSQWPSLVVRLNNDQFAIDSSLCFGFAPSGGIYGMVGAAGVDIMRSQGIGPIARWVDDHMFFCIQREHLATYNQARESIARQIAEHGGCVTKGGRTWFQGRTLPNGATEEFDEDMSFPFRDLSQASPRPDSDADFCYNLDDINRVSDHLGIPWEASKDIPFSDTPTFIGLVWDLVNHTVTLTESKRQKYLDAISKWEQRRTHTLQDVQKLHGKLLHASLIFPPGRAYLTNLEAMLPIFGDNPFKPRTPPRDTPNDLKWWKETLAPSPLPTIPILSPQPIHDFRAFSDASSSVGIGIIVGDRWRAWRFVGEWKKDGRDIAWAEGIGFEMLVQTIVESGPPGLHFQVFGDNSGVVEGWANGRSRNKHVNRIFRRLHALLQNAGCQVIAHYVPSEGNPADPLSRGIYPPANRLLPNTRIPVDAQPFLRNAISADSPTCEPFAITPGGSSMEHSCTFSHIGNVRTGAQ